MLPVIAIVGRPNVGKSTLFNALTRARHSLVLDEPNVTRDRIYGEAKFDDQTFIVIDTGGLTDTKTTLAKKLREQTDAAIQESDTVFLVVDGREGLHPADQEIAQKLRASHKKVFVLVNKTEGLDPNEVLSDFFRLGLGEPFPIAASHHQGLEELFQAVSQTIFQEGLTETALPTEPVDRGITLAIVGRPNVGKSTLVNRLLGEERVLVLDEAGTTRDSIYIPFEYKNKKYTLIDTAGVRKRGRITTKIEKFSVVKTLQAIESAAIVLLVVDAQEGLTDQDLSLIGFIIEAGKGLVIAINKADTLGIHQKQKMKSDLNYRLKFVDFVEYDFISALEGRGLSTLLKSVFTAYLSATRALSTAELSRALVKATEEHAPPMVRGRRIKLRYAHSGGENPPLIVIHGNQTEQVPHNYKRYLMSFFRKQFNLVGTPVRLEFKTTVNPYAKRRNTLTPRQLHKRKRIQQRKRK